MTLTAFSEIPPEGQISVCEVQGKVHYALPEHAIADRFSKTLSEYPRVAITRELLRTSARTEPHDVFLPVHTSLFKRLVHVWYEQGFLEALRVAASPETVDAPSWLQTTAGWTLALTRVFGTYKPEESGLHLVCAVSQTLDWERSSIRTLAWHPHIKKLAVAAWDDSVRVFTVGRISDAPVLKCKSQRLVTCLAWRPLSSLELAVGCEAGVLLWMVDQTSHCYSGSFRTLSQPGHSPVTSVAWNPAGDLLLSCSAADTGVYIWEPDSERNVCLRHVAGGGTCIASWAPGGSRVFTATMGLVFRVWETKQWKFERWTVQTGRVQSACWGANGNMLLFATTEESCLYSLAFYSDQTVFRAEVGVPVVSAQRVLDLTLIELPTGERLGGLVSTLAWDPTSKYLAIMFRIGELVAVYRTSVDHGLHILPCCLVRGYPGESPNTICFQPNFNEGALLTIAWSNGRVQYFPILSEDYRPAVNQYPNAHFL